MGFFLPFKGIEASQISLLYLGVGGCEDLLVSKVGGVIIMSSAQFVQSQVSKQ